MKKIIAMLLISGFTVSAASAQETEVKVKPVTSPTQRVHNTFSKRKHHKGYKVVTKNGGAKTRTKVKTGETVTAVKPKD